ncbi:helix-turn-helix domain-containing protein [Clostridium butyricum]
MDISTALSIVLKENRNRLHLSQEQLAFKSDLDRTYISLLERGKRKPTLHALFSISSALDIKTSDFIKQIENLL